jgi:hypothetical protein
MLAAEPLSRNPSQSSPPPPGCSAAVEPSPLDPIYMGPPEPIWSQGAQNQGQYANGAPVLAIERQHRRQNHPARRTRTSRGAPPPGRRRAPTSKTRGEKIRRRRRRWGEGLGGGDRRRLVGLAQSPSGGERGGVSFFGCQSENL